MQKGGGYFYDVQTSPPAGLHSTNLDGNRLRISQTLPYRPLPGGTFTRILRLHAGYFPEPIRCTLITIDFRDSDLQYEGISYVWGAEEPRHLITILDEASSASASLPVKPNLESALRHLRYVEYDRDVWADAICINQADLHERSHQVRLMSAIYSNANRVLVWLGPDVGGEGKEVLGAVSLIAPLIQSKITQESSAEDVSLSSVVQQYGDRAAEVFIAALRFYHHPWLGRIWCLGEIVRAYSALLICGHACAEWSALSLVTAVAKRENRFVHAGLDNAYLVDSLRSSDSDLPKLPFLRLLNLTRHYGVTDPRDRIYALKGLVHRTAEPGFDIKPDYTKSLEAVYAETARAIFDTERNLHLLSCVQHQSDAGVSDRPSWVPRWDRGCSHVLAPFDKIAASSSFNPILDLAPKVEGHTPGVISCHGADLGKVHRVFNILTHDGSHEINAECVLTLWREMRDEYHDTHSLRLEEQRLKFQTDTQGIADAELSQCFIRVLMGGLLDARSEETDGSKRPSERILGDWLTDKESKPDEFKRISSMAFEVIDTSVTACRGRSLFITDTGLFGLGPTVTKRGDVVSVLHTAPLPIVLRPHEQHNSLCLVVGETYVRLPTAEVQETMDLWKSKSADSLPLSINKSSTWTPQFQPNAVNNQSSNGLPWSNVNNYYNSTLPIIELGGSQRDGLQETPRAPFSQSGIPLYAMNTLPIGVFRRRQPLEAPKRMSKMQAVLLLEPWRMGCQLTEDNLEQAGLRLKTFHLKLAG